VEDALSRAASISALRPVSITSAIWSARGMPNSEGSRSNRLQPASRVGVRPNCSAPIRLMAMIAPSRVIIAISWSALSSTALRVAVRSATLDSRAVL
jgi:hypothetical protein